MSDKFWTFYAFDFCDSNLGQWSRSFHGSRSAAVKYRREIRKSLDGVYTSEGTGEHGEIGPVFSVTVRATKAGALEALRGADANI